MKKSFVTLCLMSLLLGSTSTRLYAHTSSPSHRVWSDLPAFTQLLEYQPNTPYSSDLYDGLWEGDPIPSLPRIPHPTYPAKRWQEGEGINVLNEETYALTRGKYSNPIRIWEAEPYPIGNGRLAASVFHGSGRDRYTLNEVSFWSGGRNAGTLNSRGDKRYNGTHGPETKDDGFGGYQPIADFIVDFNAPVQKGSFTRAIELDQGLVTATATRRGVTFTSEAYCSYPDQVMVLHYAADRPEGLSATLLYVPQRKEDLCSVEENTLVFQSTLANGIACEARVVVHPTGGTLRQEGSSIVLEGADSCTLIVAIETNYLMDATKNFRGDAPQTRIAQRLKALPSLDSEILKARHQADYKNLYNRLQLDLGTSPKHLRNKPTYQRLAAYREGASPRDVDLEEILFHFGRYLMICTSRPGSLPAGLQGIWNNMTHAPWGNDYHSNINFQMVYWLAEPANLSECHRSMIDYLAAMREPFRANTRDYLQAMGQSPETPDGEWILYTSHNPFGGGGWQVNLPGSGWCGLHLWEHYAFTQDRDYLRETAYPILKELSAYWVKHLKTLGPGAQGFESNHHPVDTSLYPELTRLPAGYRVVPNGWSPEHGPRGEDGVAHDQQIVSELFLNTIKAAEILNVDAEWRTTLKTLYAELLPPQIGRQGNLMEWMIDRDPVTDHRHTSHLFAVFPGSTITTETTPALATAARRSLELRKTTGDSRRSWAWAWRSMLWARLHHGNNAYAMLQGLITHNMLDNLFTTHHIPLQIDGNYGIAAAILEMLVQSHTDVIQLLPALPTAWPTGSVKGLKARGNITVEMHWHNGRVTHYHLSSPYPQTVTVKVNNTYQTLTLQPEEASF